MSDRPPEPFRCDVEPARGQVKVIPHGELDIATSPELDNQLRELHDSGFDRLVLDLRYVTFMDSTGLRLVLNWDEASRKNGLDFSLLPGPPPVQRLFELTGVLAQLRFADSPRP